MARYCSVVRTPESTAMCAAVHGGSGTANTHTSTEPSITLSPLRKTGTTRITAGWCSRTSSAASRRHVCASARLLRRKFHAALLAATAPHLYTPPASRSRRANNSSSAQFPRHTPLLSSVRLFSGQTKGMGQLE